MALNYESFVEALICAARPEEQQARRMRVRHALLAMGQLSEAEVDQQLAETSLEPTPADMQRDWDRMFMIDRYPKNAERFGLDVTALIRLLHR